MDSAGPVRAGGGAGAAAGVVIGIVTVSDRASQGKYEDRGGPAVQDELARILLTPWRAEARIVPDERARIEECMSALADSGECALIFTTGGTGPAPRDVTPEATAAVCDKLLPGFGERMRGVSVAQVPTAMLSRQTAGIRGKTLIVNLPGNPRAIADCLRAVFPAIPHCLAQIGAPKIETRPEAITLPDPGH